MPVSRGFDVIVMGLGGMGSAAALRLVKRGRARMFWRGVQGISDSSPTPPVMPRLYGPGQEVFLAQLALREEFARLSKAH